MRRPSASCLALKLNFKTDRNGAAVLALVACYFFDFLEFHLNSYVYVFQYIGAIKHIV